MVPSNLQFCFLIFSFFVTGMLFCSFLVSLALPCQFLYFMFSLFFLLCGFISFHLGLSGVWLPWLSNFSIVAHCTVKCQRKNVYFLVFLCIFVCFVYLQYSPVSFSLNSFSYTSRTMSFLRFLLIYTFSFFFPRHVTSLLLHYISIFHMLRRRYRIVWEPKPLILHFLHSSYVYRTDFSSNETMKSNLNWKKIISRNKEKLFPEIFLRGKRRKKIENS